MGASLPNLDAPCSAMCSGCCVCVILCCVCAMKLAVCTGDAAQRLLSSHGVAGCLRREWKISLLSDC